MRARGEVRAIAISHPHYYTGMVEWSRALGGVPILLHEADREWIMRPDDAIELWSGDTRALFGGLTLLRLGGHFAGGTVLHDANRSTLLSGDIVQVIPDRASSASCGAIPTSSRFPALRSSGSPPRSSRGRSSGSSAPGGARSYRPRAVRSCAAPPRATSPRFARGQVTVCYLARRMRGALTERRVGERVERLVQAAQLAREQLEALAELRLAVQSRELVGDPVESLEHRLELAVGIFFASTPPM